MKKKLKRRQIIIKKSFQLKYAAIVFLSMMAVAVTVTADFRYTLNVFIGEYITKSPQLENLLNNMNHLMYVRIAVLTVIAIAVSLLVSHKFAGPLFKLDQSFIKLFEGDLTYRMYLRSSDELKNFCHYFNGISDKFSKWVATDRRITKETIERINKIKSKITDTEIKKELEEIQNDLKDVSKNWKIND